MPTARDQPDVAFYLRSRLAPARQISPLISRWGLERMRGSVKQTLKYVATLFAFILVAFALSWCAVYSFWIGGWIFRSVFVVRLGDAVGHVILFPARTFFQLSGGILDQMTLLTTPLLYASCNGALLGIIAYSCCRRWIFKDDKSA